MQITCTSHLFGFFSCNKKRALKAFEELVKEFLYMITNVIDKYFNISKTEIIVHIAFSVHYHALFNTHTHKKGHSILETHLLVKF